MAESYPAPREAASVILIRETEGSPLRVLLVKRRAKASFMASAWVFPGGAVDPDDGEPRVAAARELTEETGIRLDEENSAQAGARALAYFDHWITPSVESVRFSARFYAALAPPGQEVDTGEGELEGARWIAPAEALARSHELALPPPQLGILRDLAELAARGGSDEILAACAERARRPRAILPRAAQDDEGRVALLLPWDPDYDTRGRGEALAIEPDHPLTAGPSRFILEGATWKQTYAPSSPKRA